MMINKHHPVNRTRFLCLLLTASTIFLLLGEGFWQEARWRRLRMTPQMEQREGVDLSWMDGLTRISTKELTAKKKFQETRCHRLFQVEYVVAAKLFKESRKIEDDVVHEIQLSAGLHHDGLIQFLGLIMQDSTDLTHGVLGFFMEYFQGRQLEVLLDELSVQPRSPIPWKLRIQIAWEVASALEYLHFHGIVHFDVKPEQILVQLSPPDHHLPTASLPQDPFSHSSEEISAKLIDYGLALRQAKGSQWINGQLEKGTRHYLAPEIFLDDKHVTKQVDVYSYGVVLWEMFTRSYPYRHTNLSIVEKEIKNLHPIGLKIPKDCEVGWRDLIVDCMRWNPNARPTFQEITHRLEFLKNSTFQTLSSEESIAGTHETEGDVWIHQRALNESLKEQKALISFSRMCTRSFPSVGSNVMKGALNKKQFYLQLFRTEVQRLSWEDRVLIGEGMYGQVYKTKLNLIAKTFKGELDEAKARELFLHGVLRHQNFLQFFALLINSDGRPQGVLLEDQSSEMELLEDYIEREHPIPRALILELISQLLELIFYLGRFQVSLNNLHPRKILVKETLNSSNSTSIFIKVFDLSEARCKAHSSQASCEGQGPFLDPMVCSGKAVYGFRSDLYSVGQILRFICGKEVSMNKMETLENFDRERCGVEFQDLIFSFTTPIISQRPSLISIFQLLKQWRKESKNI